MTVVGSIIGRGLPKTLKLVQAALSLDVQHPERRAGIRTDQPDIYQLYATGGILCLGRDISVRQHSKTVP